MDPLNSHFKHTQSHTSTAHCKSLMLNATVSLSKWTEQTLVPCSRDTEQSFRRALLLCLLLFHEGVMLHLDTYHQLPVRTEEIHGGTSETPGSFLLLQARFADTVATTPFMWLPRNMLNHQRYTHWQAVIAGAPYCVSTLKLIWVSVSLNVSQSSPCRHLTAYTDSKVHLKASLWLV